METTLLLDEGDGSKSGPDFVLPNHGAESLGEGGRASAIFWIVPTLHNWAGQMRKQYHPAAARPSSP